MGKKGHVKETWRNLKVRGGAQLTDTAFLAGGLDRADWRKRKYLPPSVDEAQDDHEASLFDEGQASFCRVTLNDMSALGVGMALYFRLVLYLAAFFVLASLAALPAILLNAGGQRFTDEEVDPLGLARLTLGNLGPAPGTTLGNTTAEEVNALTITMPFFGTSFTLGEAAEVTTYADFAYSILFIAFAAWWVHKLHVTERTVDDENVTAADYAVYVRGLPKNATAGQVRAHFDSLYNLRQPDWTFASSCTRCYCGAKSAARRQFYGPSAATRLEQEYSSAMRARAAAGRRGAGCCGGGKVAPLPRAKVDWRDWFVSPVLNATNTNDSKYLKSWVAEVTLAYPNGSLLRRYRSLQRLRTRLLHARAVIKVYTDPKGWDSSRAGCCGVECETDCGCVMGVSHCCQVRSGTLGDRVKTAEEHLKRIEARLRNLDMRHATSLSGDVFGAFVIFNNEESYRRCLMDYQDTDAWYNDLCGCGGNWCCQAPPLRFKGEHPLVVTPAPEPSDVIWENLQTSQAERCVRVTLTNVAMLAFLIASFTAIVLSQRQQEEFSNTLPAVVTCAQSAPSIVFGGAQNIPDVLPQLNRIPENDPACTAALNDGRDYLYLWYDPVTAPTAPAPGVGLTASLLSDAGAVVGSAINLCAGPCVPKDITADDPCIVPPAAGTVGPTTTFPVRNMVGCFCQQALQRAVDRSGILSGAAQVLSDFPECEQLASAYAFAQILIVIAAGGIVIINTGLQGFLASVTTLEHHDSVSHLKNATAVKLFLALFLNTGLLVLLVHAQVPGARETVDIPLFTGTFTSFSPAWYTAAGSSVALTMLINVAAPHALPLARYLCVYPCRRRCCRGGALVQSELNDLYAAPQFEIESRVPHVMNTVVVTLLYSSGLPLLLPMAALALLVTFAIDKLLLLRFYARPPLLDSAMAQLAARIMPFAILVHCAFAVWFYGDEDTIASTPLLLGDPGGVGAEERYQELLDSTASWDTIGFAPRVSRQNTFPMFFLFVVVAVGLLLRLTAGRLLLALIKRAFFIISCGALCTGKETVHENFNPPYTAEFERKIPLGVKTALSPEDQELGWRIVDDNMRSMGAQAQVKLWASSGSEFGVVHCKGDFMLTWQVIAEYGIASYDMAANPKYAQAVLAMERGAAHAAAHAARQAAGHLKASAAKVGTMAAAVSVLGAAAAESKRGGGGAAGGRRSQRALRPSGASALLPRTGGGSHSARGGGAAAPAMPAVSPGRTGPLPSLRRGSAQPEAAVGFSPNPPGRLRRPGSFTVNRTGKDSLLNDPSLTVRDVGV